MSVVASTTGPADEQTLDARQEAERIARELFEAMQLETVQVPLRRPGATYRVQMHKGFGLDDLSAVIDYLAALNVTDCYMSPYLEAKPGSTHGYDVFNHGRLNPEVGDEAAHERLVSRLREREMGRVLDVVPNHMGIAGPNPYWLEVLEIGRHAPSARFFDIDWHPVKDELENRVLLPILEDLYGRVLEAGLLTLERDHGAFFIRYHDFRLPVAPKSYELILERRADVLQSRFHPDDVHVREYRSIWAAAHHLPNRAAGDPESIELEVCEKEVIKRRLERLCKENSQICAFIDENVASLHGTQGNSYSFDGLHALLEQQVYRLAYWRVASDEINYRRFFDINELAGLRAEDPTVFDVIHGQIFRWIDDGGVTGLRIDHPDGLADPLGYLERLQEQTFLRACQRRLAAHAPHVDWWLVSDRLRRLYRETIQSDRTSPLARRFPIVVEKILSRGEDLPEEWPVDGTVGYEFLNALNGLFVDGGSSEAMDAVYADFTGDREPFPEVLYRAKHLITRSALASEINTLARMLNRISEGSRVSRDFTLNDLTRVVRESIACFPIYRTYIQPDRPVSARDRGYIDQAVARARRRNPTVDGSVFQFLREVLLLEHPPNCSHPERALREQFVIRFQQTTGPVQAKGLEDTAFYRQVRLVSLNEVGADPLRFGNSMTFFHGVNAQRQKLWTGALGTTATHDTKRGEDARIRIDALSELTGDWKIHLARWSRWNARKKIAVDDVTIPDTREEYLFYQALIGAWPHDAADEATPAGLTERVQQYMIKAAREAKVNTTWTDSDHTYVDSLAKYVSDVLEAPDSGPFLKDFVPFHRRVSRIAVVHSLAQTLIKLVSPGVPDIYQGCELWDLSLVDPDNRRPVDYNVRARLLESMGHRLESGVTRAQLAEELFAKPDDGAIKLYLVWTALEHRKQDLPLYQQGSYRPLEADGERKANVIAFGRGLEGRNVVAIAPRLVGGMMGEEALTTPVGAEVWGETRLLLPEGVGTRGFRDILTDRRVDRSDAHGGASLLLRDVFQRIPLALLVEAAE